MTQTSSDDARLMGASSRQAEVLAAVTERGMIRVTDLAAELGVTPVTVRRAVSELAEAGLVRRVHGGATAVGARAMGGPVAQGTATIGMLVPSLDYYWPDVARGAEEEAKRLGLRVTLRGSVYQATDERGDLQRLIDAGASGLLVAPTLDGAGGDVMREWLAEAPVPVVLMERNASVGSVQRTVESVITDHADGTTMAVHHLVGLGHRLVGVALSQDSPHTPRLRADWLATCGEHGLDPAAVVDRFIPDRREPGFEPAIESIIDEVVATGTTALLVHSDPEAIRLIQRAEERGLSVPGDLSVVSYDDQVAAMSAPALTAVRPPRRTIGRTAVGLLAARMADPGRPVHRVLVSPTLMVRDSSGPPGA
ncbi:LacI family DNA-binding transcriptional regulator [Ruania alba]|uniref:DNA-binding transcriptional regulator, LacI/PurR family n=1 Tax=Ruania alba TaxID=648782 RepID=A0A1H5M189_9MICO|nr:LacI family DNA-binding transcriptional regulator [Ruania alba]SEE83125.1 DNA-binding transcriptional regulator, LacI/PurR family [Ruania alba]